jgi:type I restriction enzyme S subunit
LHHFKQIRHKSSSYKLKNILERVAKPVEVVPEEKYTQIGIRSHGKGIFIKEDVTGKELGNKRVFWIEPNCFILNIVFAWERAVAQTTDELRGLIASHRFPMYKLDETKVDLDYFTRLFLTKKGQTLLELASPGGAGRNKTLGQKEFLNLEIELPSIESQKFASAFFKNLDKKIQLQQEKIILLQERKKGYIQKTFCQELRFKDKNGQDFPTWKIKKIEDGILNLKSGLSRKLDYKDIGIPVIRANNIEDGKLNFSDIKYWYVNDPQGANTQNYLIKEGDILINFINSEAKMGTTTIVEEKPYRDMIYTTNLLKLETNASLNNYYFYMYSQTQKYKNYIKLITKPAVNQASFTTVDFKAHLMPYPCIEEQIKIAEFFKIINDKIYLEEQKRQYLLQQKQAFMQQMFI